MSRDTKPPAPDTVAWFEWWGHRSDLRHAGLLAEHRHLQLAALEAIDAAGYVVAPSACQSWGPNHDAYNRAVAAAEDAQ